MNYVENLPPARDICLSKTLPLKVFCGSKEPARRLQHSIVGPPLHSTPHNLSAASISILDTSLLPPTVDQPLETLDLRILGN